MMYPLKFAHILRTLLLAALIFTGASVFAFPDQAPGRDLRNEDIAPRIAFYANYFLIRKSPYIVSPLGEGAGSEFESGPLYRFDGFDCTTFVETVMALALTSTPEDFQITMNRIRYKDGRVAYEARNHFPSTDWIPNNTRAGFVKDITTEVGGVNVKLSRTWIEKDNWFRMKGTDYQKLSRQFKKELGRISYISKEDLLAQPDLVGRIPSGAVFHVVRPNWDLRKAIGTQLDVSHQGFLIREKGVLYMVHASNGVRDGSDDYKGVKREPLLEYVERVMKKSSSMAGINILQIQAP